MTHRLAAALLTGAALALTAGCSTPATEGAGSAFPQTTTSTTVAPNTGTAPADTTWLKQYGDNVTVETPVITKGPLGQFIVKIRVTNPTKERLHPSAIMSFYDGNGVDVGGGDAIDDSQFYLDPGASGTLVLEGGKFTEAYETYNAEMTTYLPRT